MSLSKAGRDSLANVVLMFLCKINSLRVLATAKRWVFMNESVFSMNSSYHIANELFAALSKQIGAPALVDYGLPSPVRLNRGALLVLALRLARDLKSETSEDRVGVVLPPGLAGVLANLALFFAGKVSCVITRDTDFMLHGVHEVLYTNVKGTDFQRFKVCSVVSHTGVLFLIRCFRWIQE